MKKRIILSSLPSRYTLVPYLSFRSNTSLLDNLFKLFDSSSILTFIMAGVYKKKITVLYDEYKHSYIILVPKKSGYFIYDSFKKAITSKFNSSSLFPQHYFYSLNSF